MKTILKYLAMVRSLKYLSPEYDFILLNAKWSTRMCMKEILFNIISKKIF